MKKSNIYAAATVSFVLYAAMMTGCDLKKKKDAPAAAKAEEEIVYAVNSFRTSAGNLDEYLEFGGDIATVSSVDVMPDMAGKISQILVNVGDMVKKDQIIAYVDASRPGMNYRASPVKAPISGRITSFAPTTGTMVSQSVSIAKISKTDDLEIRVNVAERFISRIKLGEPASVTFDAYPGVTFNAKVFEMSPVIDTTTRTMAVKLRLDPPDSRIKVGMYARIRLVTDSIQNAIVIPSPSIVSREGKTYVFVVNRSGNGATARLQPVTQGMTVDNKTEITSGLTAGDEIVSKGQSLLNDGAKINIIATTGAAQ